ncbi:DUF418 domain-containing protein [Paenibacillus sp. MABNR03]|uniref:DUF418 domain-containing protein n=1 Tax=Paenibacillus sp. MABNR03 TaxID=3142626 RepID=UPI003D2AA9BF
MNAWKSSHPDVFLSSEEQQGNITFYLSTLLLWSQRKQFARLLDPLHAFGRMALTNYGGSN